MKKLLLTAAMVLVSLSGYAQGNVLFANTPTTRVTDSGVNVPGTANVLAALYWAPLSNPDSFTQLGATARVGETGVQPSGVFNGGERLTGPATAGGAQARFQVRVWEAAYGSTYEAARSAPAQNGRTTKYGESNIIQIQTGDPMAVPPGTPASLTGMQGIALVPEPSVIALGVIGAGALLLLRRRK
jgi:hypothetical protein